MGDLLLAAGRPAEAEQVDVDAYIRASSPDEAASYRRMSNPALVQLAKLYYRLNRPEDVKLLLDGAPDWGSDDVLNLTGIDAYDDYLGTDPIAFVAAWALAKTSGTRPKRS